MRLAPGVGSQESQGEVPKRVSGIDIAAFTDGLKAVPFEELA